MIRSKHKGINCLPKKKKKKEENILLEGTLNLGNQI